MHLNNLYSTAVAVVNKVALIKGAAFIHIFIAIALDLHEKLVTYARIV